MADAYRKVGRGGAGNFYSQKDIEEAIAPQATDDVEAQKQKSAPFEEELPTDPADTQLPPASMVPTTTNTGSSPSSSGAAASTPVYVRSGRGGAGNFVDPQTASSASTIQSHAQPRPATVHTTGNQTLASSSSGGARLSGRGGAGNYSQSAAEEQKKVVVNEEQERKRREALDKHIFDDVRAGLQEPGRAHTRVHPHGRGRGATGLEES